MNRIVKMPQELRLFTTPEQLRKWADKMDEQWAKSMAGDSLIIDYVGDWKETIIAITLDQDKMK